MAPALTDRILVWSFSATVAYTLESCNWYSTDSFCDLYFSVAEFIKNQLDNFYADFSEWFNLAEFPDVGNQLQPSEGTVFLKAAGAPDDNGFDSIDNYDCFSGLCGVIRYRLDQRSIEQIKLAAELFNWTIDCGLFLTDTNSLAVIRIGSVEEVAPFLLERILNRVQENAKQRSPAHQPPPSDFEQRFLPIAPMLTMLKETVESADWIQNELALRVFFWIVEMYRAELEAA